MLYQTINPFTEEVVKTFPDHTDAQLQQILAKAEAVYESDWS
jgi:succinate-semialdehyde dehydrogenase / glutarate-semialdehyde dehydrogenase